MTISKGCRISAVSAVMLTCVAALGTTIMYYELSWKLWTASPWKVFHSQPVIDRLRYPKRNTSGLQNRLNILGLAKFREHILTIQNERQQRLALGCLQLAKLSRKRAHNRTKSTSSFIFNVPSPLSLTYCAIPKCSTTSWFNFFQRVTEKKCRENVKEFTCAADEFSRPKSVNEFLSSSLVVVRDPWSRLVSAYEDKFVVQRHVLASRCYRLNGKSLRGKTPVTFAEFVRCILNEYKDGRALNYHYAPQHWQCFLCIANYSYIAKLETLVEDFRYLATFTFPQHNFTAYQTIFSAGRRRLNEVLGITSISYEDHYRSLAPEDLEALVRLFRYDAELFDYPLRPLG